MGLQPILEHENCVASVIAALTQTDSDAFCKWALIHVTDHIKLSFQVFGSLHAKYGGSEIRHWECQLSPFLDLQSSAYCGHMEAPPLAWPSRGTFLIAFSCDPFPGWQQGSVNKIVWILGQSPYCLDWGFVCILVQALFYAVADAGFPMQRGAKPEDGGASYYLAKCFLKTTWK